MKKLYIILFIFSISICSFAQNNSINQHDIIFTVEGDEIPAQILMVGDSEVQYRKISNPDGPIFTLSNNEIFMIKYKNGEKDVFKKKKTSYSENESTLIEVPVSEDNQLQIAKYNKYYQLDEHSKKCGMKNKKCLPADYRTVIFGVTTSSILSNQDVRITIRLKEGFTSGPYDILLYNKTDKILYVDLAYCFNNNKSLYSNDVTMTTTGENKGASVSLGAIVPIASGITIGGSTSSNTTTMKQEQRIIAIPPLGEAALYTIHLLSHIKTEDLIGDKLLNFTEETGQIAHKLFLTYSSSSSFQTYSHISFELFVKQVWGIRKDFYPWIDDDEFFLKGK